jgi:hypothetical protein
VGQRTPRARERGPAVARIRLLKPGFFLNESLADCSFAARLLFAGLWCLADRDGKLEERPRKIKAELFPYDSVDICKLLAELVSHGFVVRYKHGRGNSLRRYLIIPKFLEHQKPYHREAKSRIPDPLSNPRPRPRPVTAQAAPSPGPSRPDPDPDPDPDPAAAGNQDAAVNAAVAAAAKEVEERREEEVIEALVQVGCPIGIAQAAVRNGVDLKLIDTVIRWLHNHPGKIKKPGGYHDLLHRPQKFAFTPTEDGWQPPEEERSIKDRMAERLARTKGKPS